MSCWWCVGSLFLPELFGLRLFSSYFVFVSTLWQHIVTLRLVPVFSFLQGPNAVALPVVHLLRVHDDIRVLRDNGCFIHCGWGTENSQTMHTMFSEPPILYLLIWWILMDMSDVMLKKGLLFYHFFKVTMKLLLPILIFLCNIEVFIINCPCTSLFFFINLPSWHLFCSLLWWCEARTTCYSHEITPITNDNNPQIQSITNGQNEALYLFLFNKLIHLDMLQ